MRNYLLLLVLPILLANAGSTPRSLVASEFTAALVKNDLAAAKKMMVPEPKIAEWSKGAQSLSDLAAFLQTCPVDEIDDRKDGGVDVWLTCGGDWNGASIDFDNALIKTVKFGPPPGGMSQFMPRRIRRN